jgi:hypothetical protein
MYFALMSSPQFASLSFTTPLNCREVWLADLAFPLIKALSQWPLLESWSGCACARSGSRGHQFWALFYNVSATIREIKSRAKSWVESLWHSKLDIANQTSKYQWAGPAALN